MTTELQAVLAEIRAIHEDLARISKSISELRPSIRVEARAVTVKEAAKRLSIGLTKTRQLIRNGTIQMVDVGVRRMVPVSEIERLTTPRAVERVTKPQRPSKQAKPDSDDLREWLKTQRKKH